MTAFSAVRFRGKTGRDQEFLDAHRKVAADWPGLKRINLINTGDRGDRIIGEWTDMDALAAARPNMLATLDSFRHALDDLGGGLGVTDAVSGPVVLELRWRVGTAARSVACVPRRLSDRVGTAPGRMAKRPRSQIWQSRPRTGSVALADKSVPLSQGLIGTRELLSGEDTTPSGERRIDRSLESDPFGTLYYGREGHFAAQFMRRDREAGGPEIAGTYELTARYPDGLAFNPAYGAARYRPGHQAVHPWRILPGMHIPVDPSRFLALRPRQQFPYDWLAYTRVGNRRVTGTANSSLWAVACRGR